MGLKQSLKLSQEFAREHTARQFGQLATLQWVHWFDHTRLLKPIGEPLYGRS